MQSTCNAEIQYNAAMGPTKRITIHSIQVTIARTYTGYHAEIGARVRTNIAYTYTVLSCLFIDKHYAQLHNAARATVHS